MEKKILIVKPPYETFPLGFAYVLSCLESNNIPFDFIDTEFGHDYKKLIRKNDYLAVASGGLIGHFNFFRELTDQVRKIDPELPVIIGGNITKDIRPDFLLDKIGANYGIVGEAETSFPYLIDILAKKSDNFNDIPGLIFRDQLSGEINKNVSHRLELSVNILPAWHYIDVDYYIKSFSFPYWGLRSAMPVLSGRGCVGRCSFCSPTIGSFRMRQVEHVIQEIEYLNSKYDFEWIVFMNEMFYKSKEEISRFCSAYKELSPPKKWVCSLRVDADVDTNTFIEMKEAGCLSISAGIESGSDKVLKLMNKRTTAERIKNFFRDTKTAGLLCNGTFLVGNEGETEDDLKETIDMVINEEMSTMESLTNAYPGTLIYRNALKKGLIEDEWDYLQKLRFGCWIWDREWTNRQHMNISAIPDELFWHVIVKELRRFGTFLLNRFNVKDIKYKISFGSLLVNWSGNCPECGSRVSAVSPYRLLGIETLCRNCFRRVFFNPYKTKDFESNFELISDTFKKASRLAVLGTKYEAVSLLRYDYFGLNYDSIVGFVESDNNQVPCSDFFDKPRLQMNDLPNVQPDTILIVDDQFGDAELILRLFYIRHNLQLPIIIHLWPDSKRRVIRMIRFADKYGVASILNITFMQLILFYSWARKAVYNTLKTNYSVLLRLRRLNWIRPILLKLSGYKLK